jgi:type IV secretion system protein VirB6
MVPMFTVLIGGAALTMITPLIRDALMDQGSTSTKAVTALFLGACVYCALMAIVVKTTSVIVAGWRLPFGATPEPAVQTAAAPAAAPIPVTPLAARAANAQASDTVRSIVAALPASGRDGAAGSATAASNVRHITREIAAPTATSAARETDRRLEGVGSRFRASPAAPSRALMK